MLLGAVLSCGKQAENGQTAVVDVTPFETQTPASETPPSATETPHETLQPMPESTADELPPAETPTAEETATPAPTLKPTPEPTVAPTPVPEEKPLSGYIIGIDPGHQRHSNHDKELNAPGSDVMKNKVSAGTEGTYTHTPEYQVNLDVGLLLRDMLEEAGATVVMTRTSNDVDISNIERAQLFNANKTDYALRLHCNDSDNPDVRGAFMLVPEKNPYKDECVRAAQLLIDAYCGETGAKNLGLRYRYDQTGFNWCERMIINIEMGHMSNYEEDYLLSDAEYQRKMAKGLFKGICEYFGVYA